MGLPYIIVTFCALNIFVILIFLMLLKNLITKNFHLLTVLQCTYSFPYGVVTEETAYLSNKGGEGRGMEGGREGEKGRRREG